MQIPIWLYYLADIETAYEYLIVRRNFILIFIFCRRNACPISLHLERLYNIRHIRRPAAAQPPFMAPAARLARAWVKALSDAGQRALCFAKR